MLLAAFAAMVSSMVVGLVGLRHRGLELLYSGAVAALWLTSIVLATMWFEHL
jgi:hypothetical protein